MNQTNANNEISLFGDYYDSKKLTSQYESFTNGTDIPEHETKDNGVNVTKTQIAMHNDENVFVKSNSINRQKFKPIHFSDYDLNSIKDRAAELLPHFLSKAHKSGYVCPCNNGRGEDGTGINVLKNNPQIISCRVCGNSWNIFQLVQDVEHIDFPEAVKRCADILGMNVGDSASHSIKPAPTFKTHVYKVQSSTQKDFTEFFNRCHCALIDKQNSAAMDYLKSRSLDDIELIKKFQIGFDEVKQAIIIPHDKAFFTARKITNEKSERFKGNPAGTHVILFNSAALHNPDNFIFVTEGAFDALSLIKVGFQAVAVGGVGNFKTLIKALETIENKPKFIILFDSDEAGKSNSLKLHDALLKLQVFSINETLPAIEGKQADSNDWLKYNPQQLKEIIEQKISTAQDFFKNWTSTIIVTETPKQLNNEIDEFDKQSAIQDTQTQKAIETLQSITDFSKNVIYSEEILHAAAICYVYAIKDFETFREQCEKCGIRVGLLDSKIKTYSKPIQKEKDRREKQRWNKIKEAEYKQQQQERERLRLENVKKVQELSNDENIEPDKLIELIHHSLEYDHKGKVLQNTRNFNLIIYNDPYIKNAVGFNAFNNRMTPLKKLTWQDELVKAIAWRDSDDSGMQNYIDVTYNLRNDKIFKDAVDEYAHRHSFHPVRDFFNNLPEWDGVPRAETLFIDSLEVEDCEYARKVTFHWLLGGVARIFNPGCKFDYTLVTKGKQGIGKSTILRKLTVNPDWFNDSLDSFEGKDALEALQGKWIIEIGEMAAARKSENEKIKSFISRQIDDFRKSYGHRNEAYPRQCIFSATTNSEEFLKDRTGGRRFLILVSEAKPYTIKKRMQKFTKDYILQIWAEVYHFYNEMFNDAFDDTLLDIPAHLKDIAKEYQDKYTEGGALAGFVTEYLEKEFPINWESLPKIKRRLWIRGDESVVDCNICKKRDIISAHEIAFEMLNIDNPGKDKATINEIGEIVANLSNWKRFEKPKRLKEYGVQKVVFQRLNNPLADD